MVHGHTIKILFLAILCKVELEKITRLSCRNEGTFKASGKDRIIKASSSILISNVKVASLAYCARNCIKANKCKSFVFKKNAATAFEKNCQLLNAEGSNVSLDEIQNSAGWIYYEPLQQVRLRITFPGCVY